MPPGYFITVDREPQGYDKLSETERQRFVVKFDGPTMSSRARNVSHPQSTLCPLFVAIVNQDDASVRKAMKEVDPSATYMCGVHPRFTTGRCWTYLSYALVENHIPTIKSLLSNDDVARSVYKRDYQPLRWALEDMIYTEALVVIVNELGKDANEPSVAALRRIKDAFNSPDTLRRNKEVVKSAQSAPGWFTALGSL